MGNGVSNSVSGNTVEVREGQAGHYNTTSSPIQPSAPPQPLNAFDSGIHDIDEDIEAAVAPPNWISDQRLMSPSSSTCGYTTQHVEQSTNATQYDKRGVQEDMSSPEDEIQFEVYHCSRTGAEYTLINSDGVRFFLDNWNTGTVYIYIRKIIFKLDHIGK